ncbi:MAG TPA: 3'(2'),5'-bisphosphate nucleotidase CysQ [Micropepsaceae bacterium]|nr:3'(2'),5'-bisphosphate nucleotidase CysQ [Micropepsaceae bacterium]
MPASDDAADTRLLVAELREAGEIARHYFGGKYKSWNKSHGNPVTEADIEIDNFLRQRLLAARPAYGWLSEETADDPVRLLRKRVFVVDPIDGTYGFLKHRPDFTIVAAVVENGRPVAGAIYNPITDDMFEATKGAGAQKNGDPSRVSSRSKFEGARFLAEKKVMDPGRWANPWPGSITVETRASAAYRMALVAAGEFDAMISLSPKSDWDVAAGDLIVHEAGGRVTTREGDLLIYNREKPEHRSVICAGPPLQARLLARLHDFRPGS